MTDHRTAAPPGYWPARDARRGPSPRHTTQGTFRARTGPVSAPTEGPSALTRTIALCSLANLFLLLGCAWLIWQTSETWWVGSLLTFLPREPLLIPTVVLVCASSIWHRPSLLFHALSISVAALGIIDWSWPLETLPPVVDGPKVRIASCNVQSFEPDFPQVVRELRDAKPDLIVFQEALSENRDWEEPFMDWHRVHVEYFWVASRWPLKILKNCDNSPYQRTSGLVVEVQHPEAPFAIADIHLMTARPALRLLKPASIWTGTGPEELAFDTMQRDEEMMLLRTAIEEARGNRPLIIAGDFNTPASSTLFRRSFGDLQGGFETAGYGRGYSAPCRKINYWPTNTPWARIDHIRVSPDWAVTRFETGTGSGSDHRMIWAELVLQTAAASAPASAGETH